MAEDLLKTGVFPFITFLSRLLELDWMDLFTPAAEAEK
jgi:hypothetical protein